MTSRSLVLNGKVVGSATFDNPPSNETMQAVQQMAAMAYHKSKNEPVKEHFSQLEPNDKFKFKKLGQVYTFRCALTFGYGFHYKDKAGTIYEKREDLKIIFLPE